MGIYQKSTTDTSKYIFILTFDVLLVDIGYEISTKTYSSKGVKFKYSDMGYSIICRYCDYESINMNSINFGGEVKSLTSSSREFQVVGPNVLTVFLPNVAVFVLLTTKCEFFLK